MRKIRTLFNDTETTKNSIEKIEIKDNKLSVTKKIKRIIVLLTEWVKHN